jgi:hypothetical protein
MVQKSRSSPAGNRDRHVGEDSDHHLASHCRATACAASGVPIANEDCLVVPDELGAPVKITRSLPGAVRLQGCRRAAASAQVPCAYLQSLPSQRAARAPRSPIPELPVRRQDPAGLARVSRVRALLRSVNAAVVPEHSVGTPAE